MTVDRLLVISMAAGAGVLAALGAGLAAAIARRLLRARHGRS